MSWIPQRSHSDASLNYQFIFEQETTMLKEYIKWEWSLQILWEWCSQCKGLLFEWQKKKPCQTKTLLQRGLQNGHCKTLLSPPRKVSGFPSLPVLARAPQGEQCPFGGWNSLSPCSLWVSDRAVTGRVPRRASGPCFQWPPALKHSFQWLTFDYSTSLCSSYHTTVEIPHYKDADNKSPGSDGWFVSCCAGPLRLRAYPKWELCSYYFSPLTATHWLRPLQMLWAWGRRATALQLPAENSLLLWRKATGFSF